MQPTILNFIKDQFWTVEPVVRADLTGKTIVIIGANVGLGFEAAKHFASMNPKRLVLGCRSQEKGQAAVQGKCVRGHGMTGPPLTNNVAQPYKLLASKMWSSRSSTSPNLHLFPPLQTRSFATAHK